VKVRELRKPDATQALRFLASEFPQEEAILGTRPEGLDAIVRRVFRWDTRLILGLLRLAGRPVFNFFVVEEENRIVGTTILSFESRAGYLSMVVIDPGYRRRGFAQALLERSRTEVAKTRRPYVALDVLAENAPARALYERMGYRTLRVQSFLAHDDASRFPPGPPPSSIRAFRRSDARALVAIVRQDNPPEVENVLPRSEASFRGSSMGDAVMQATTAAWVVDRGRGVEAWIRAVVSPATEAGHLAAPVIGAGVEPELAAELVRTAGTWIAAHGSRRIAAQVPAENRRGRAALDGGGFHEAFQSYTLYRTVA